MTPAQLKWEHDRHQAERNHLLDVLSDLVEACNSLAPYAPVSQLQQDHVMARATETIEAHKARAAK